MYEGNIEGGLQYELCILKSKKLFVLVIEFSNVKFSFFKSVSPLCFALANL